MFGNTDQNNQNQWAGRLVPLALMLLWCVFFVLSARAASSPVDDGRDTLSTSRVYIIAAGVNRYPKIQRLRYAVADAEAFADALQSQWKKVGTPVDVQILREDGLTRDALQKAFSHVASAAEPNDLFVFYFAGLSATTRSPSAGEDEYYLLTSGCSLKDSSASARNLLAGSAIQAALLKNWCAGIQAKKQLIVLDSYGSQSKLEAFVDQATQSSTERQINNASVVLLTAEGIAIESDTYHHGLLTYLLLKGLEGGAVLNERFSGITARELEAYLPAQVIKISNGNQIFRGYSWGEDFSIAPLPDLAPVPPAEMSMRQTDIVNEPPAPVEEKSPQPGKNYALIFATDHYDEWKPLSNPIHDAQALAEELRTQYGYVTQIVQNPTKLDILTILSQYRKRDYGPADQLFVFFAGHGTKGNGDGYLIPRDSKRQDEFFQSDVQFASLKSGLTTFPCPHILLALDVCYGGNFANDSVLRLPAAPRLTLADFAVSPAPSGPSPDMLGLAARLMKDKSRVFLSSGQDVPVPDGAAGGHSPFMEKLLGALEQGRKQNKVVTARAVYEETLKTPTEPQYAVFDNRHPEGDFVFVPVTNGTSAL